MKLKLAFVAIASTLFISHANATIVGTTTNFSKVTVMLNVYTNAPAFTNSTSESEGIGKAALGNLQLIRAFAGWNGITYTNNHASDTNWNGALLIYDWETDQPCVADRTGTNVLFYLGDGIHGGGTNAFFTIEWIDHEIGTGRGPRAETLMTTNPGSDKYTQLSRAFFDYFYNDGSDHTDIWAHGASVDHFAQFWDSLGNPTYWTDSRDFKPANADQDVILHNQSYCAVDGLITALGNRKGTNPVLTP